MKLLSSVAVTLFLFAASVQAAPRAIYPTQVISKSDQLHQFLIKNASGMNQLQLGALDQALNGAMFVAKGGNLGGCRVLGWGKFRSNFYPYRLWLNGEAHAGIDSFGEFIQIIGDFQANSFCPRKFPSVCTLTSSGKIGMSGFDYRISIDGNAIVGSNSFVDVLSYLKQLRDVGACSGEAPLPQCVSLGTGPFGDFPSSILRYRIGINGVAIFGSNHQNELPVAFAQLRAARVCR